MKRNLQIIINVSAASVLAFSALAQDATKLKADSQDDTNGSVLRSLPLDRLNGAVKSTDVIGITVKNYKNEKVGKVEDLAVDVESGRIVLVILSIGGYVGIGDAMTIVPPVAFQHDVTHKVLLLDANREKLDTAPEFEMSKWAQCCEPNYLLQVYRHYGQEAALNFVRKGDAVRDGQRKTDASPSTPSTLSSETQPMIPGWRLIHLQKAGKIKGMAMKNLQNEKLGKVENMLMDLQSGRVVAVIASSGGFLGLGDELSAVPPSALRFTEDWNTLQLDVSKQALDNAPHFKATDWPDFTQPGYVYEVYRAYKVQPYFARNAAVDVDNTVRNLRDLDDRALTPLNQGNSQADLNTTAQIRKEIIANKNLSLIARNVKVITNKGRVTLRGPVYSADEKRLIGEIAERIAGTGNVDNQLEVKLSTTSNN